MIRNEVAKYIDHAVLKPNHTDDDVRKACEMAKRWNIASVCVKPCHVLLAKKLLEGSDVKVCTVIGFPNGSTTTATKAFETIDAIMNGASEIDMVMNVGKLISGDEHYVLNDIKQIINTCHSENVICKVIIETSLLTDDLMVKACELVKQAGADYVKTSTGFNGGGATLEDIALMKNTVGDQVKIKASGGIKTYEQAVAFIEAGCSRFGTSSTEEILSGGEGKEMTTKKTPNTESFYFY